MGFINIGGGSSTPTWGETLAEGASADGTSPVMGTTAILFGSSSEQSLGDNGGDLQATNTSGSFIVAAQSGTDTTTFTVGNNGNTTLVKSGLASASKIVWDVANQTPTVTFTQDTTGTAFTHQFTFPTLTGNRVATFQDGTGTVAYLSDITSDGMFDAANAGGTWAVTSYNLGGNTTQAQGANTFAITSTAVNAFSVDGTTFSVDASNNRVGVRTSAPAVALHVEDDTGVRIKSPSAGYGDINIIPYAPSHLYDSIDFNSGEELRVGGAFGAKTNKWRFLSSSGTNVQIGINTDSPGATLDLLAAGNSGLTNAVVLKNSSGTALFTLRDDGLLGLGVAPIASVTFATTGRISFASLPTSSAGLGTGEIWNNSGVVNIV